MQGNNTEPDVPWTWPPARSVNTFSTLDGTLTSPGRLSLVVVNYRFAGATESPAGANTGIDSYCQEAPRLRPFMSRERSICALGLVLRDKVCFVVDIVSLFL